MRIFSFIPALAALVTVAAGLSVPPDACNNAEFGCDTHAFPKRDFLHHPSRNFLTNAELLRRGLPLKGPILRRGSPVRRVTASNVPPTPVTTTNTGVIEVYDSQDNLMGYVSKNMVNGRQYGYDPSLANALSVTFDTDQTGSGTQLNIRTTNSNPSWPLLACIFADVIGGDLLPGTQSSVVLGGVTDPGSNPGDSFKLLPNSYSAMEFSESAVWSFTSATGDLTPQWINGDKSTPALQTFAQGNKLYAGADLETFNAFNAVQAYPVTFKFLAQPQ